MKIRCAWHEQNFGHVLMMGEKEPLDNKETTDGMCLLCHAIGLAEILAVNIELGIKRLHRAKELI